MMRANGNNKFDDRTVLSRHLASGNSAESATRLTIGATSTDWLSIAYPMGNLAPNLRRSMPAMSSSDGTGAEQRPGIQRGIGTIRHSSFSSENGAAAAVSSTGSGRCRQKQPQQQQNQDEVEEQGRQNVTDNTRTDQERNHGRCISVHSLSPSGSMLLHNSASSASSSSSSGPCQSAAADDGAAAAVVDTRQIQVFLKKREDSVTTVSTELSDTLSVGKGSTAASAGGAQKGTTISTGTPPATTTATNHLEQHFPSKELRAYAVPRSLSDQSSVSSSLDSAKEEWVITNFDHSTASQRVVPLPRPVSMQNDVSWGEQQEEEETAKTPVPAAPPALSSPIPPLLMSAWHSTSDLTPSARTMVPVMNNLSNNSRRGSTVSRESGTDGGTEKQQAVSPLPKRSQSQAGHRKSNYLGELVWQVDETVFCGGIEAVQNRNLLCRLNIEYIVDLSGQEDDLTHLDSRPRSEFPCLCPRRTAHSRMTMAMTLKDDSQQQLLGRETRPSTAETKAQLMEREQIIRYFETLIDLIRKARISQKKVLIHSQRGRNRAPAFVAAYLMHCNRITRVQAINRITKLMCSMRPGLCISDNLQRALMRWQFMLGIRAECSRLDSQSLNKMFAVKRNAWI